MRNRAQQSFRRRLVERIRPALRLIARAIISAARTIDRRPNPRYRKEPVYAPGQWHRWYKEDQRHKRQCRSLKQLGMRLDAPAWNLPRRAVR